jgi:hypothetical protein
MASPLYAANSSRASSVAWRDVTKVQLQLLKKKVAVALGDTNKRRYYENGKS